MTKCATIIYPILQYRQFFFWKGLLVYSNAICHRKAQLIPIRGEVKTQVAAFTTIRDRTQIIAAFWNEMLSSNKLLR